MSLRPTDRARSAPPVCALAVAQQISRTRAKPRPKSMFAFKNFRAPTTVCLSDEQKAQSFDKACFRHLTLAGKMR